MSEQEIEDIEETHSPVPGIVHEGSEDDCWEREEAKFFGAFDV